LTENREEIEIKIADDDMSETAKEIGLLVGDEDPRMAQTAVAQREAEQARISALAAAAAAGEGGVALADEEADEDEEVEASDEEVAAASASPRIIAAPEIDDAGLGALPEDLVEAEVAEEPVVDDSLDEGYQLEDEEAEPEEEAEDEETSPLAVEEEF
jgi:hypothetical protein